MLQDLRFAWRALLEQPGFTVVALLTIALGVGANSAIFSVVDAVMLRPLPVADPDRVVFVNESLPQFPVLSLSRENYTDVCAQAQAFVACGAYRNTTLNLSGSTEPRRVTAKMLSANLPALVGVAPLMGRPFTPQEDARGGERVVLLSYTLWQTQFGGRSDVIGQRVLLDGEPYTIVGVMPASFRVFQTTDLYLPLGPFLATQPDDRSWHPGIQPIARLKSGVSVDQARTEVAGIAQRLTKAYPITNTNVTMLVTPAQEIIVQGVRTALLVLLAAVAGVLLIACINVAGLLLARGISRRRDLAIRIALGASHGRIVRHLLAESVTIALGGGAAGLLLASLSVPLLLQLVGPTLPRADSVSVDARVAVFTFGVALLTGVVFGLIPALQSARVDVREALNEAGRSAMSGGRWQHRARAALVVAEIAVTLVLTIGAALLLRSFAHLQNVAPGFEADHALASDLPLSSIRYARDDARTAAVEHVIERVAALPGVRSAAVATQLPMSGNGAAIHFNIKGRPAARPDNYALANFRVVSGAYFQTLRTPLKRGRLLNDRDREGSPHVIVINEAMVRQFFAGEDPLGQHIQLGALPAPDPPYPYMEIVGVVGDVRQQPDAEAKSEMYVPYDQYPVPILRRLYSSVVLVARTDGPPEQLAPAVRAVVREVDPDQPVANVRTLEDVLAASVQQPRFRTLLLGVFAGIALLLAAIGVYGLLAHAVAQRVTEFGVRMAVGASPARVLGLVLRQGAVLAVTGVGIGLAGAVLAVRALRTVLFDITPWDPVAWVTAAATLLVVSVLATWLPARRAVKVDPVVALRA
jgi:putative ABC transport system permease protein